MQEKESQKSRELSEAERRLTLYLEEAGKRQTPERFAILAEVFKFKGHFRVNQLLEAMDKTGYHVSRATVYNTVEILCACGILRRHLLESHQATYELAQGNHIHLVCSVCGSVEEIYSPGLAGLLLSENSGNFRPHYFSATVFGLCGECQRLTRNSDTQ